ncbi:type II and III secretion system protein family protein [Actibacterium sp. 188UL27-1]|uniref:type II and III secretion system protein family protein n=1 Tax=Actibacterium sp. 188UL27-1 TaxID=2786961 RepID=UPI00195D9B53|nr:type II and III secretion system protein family protein [Actibacterium sp. 188UL27-1]MBM7068211.1 type II and III secretion system protein family protein [Actibacterium sp. 188UL27-1]
MALRALVRAGLIGLSLTIGLAGVAPAQTLRVMSGAPSTNLKVPINRAVVVQSDAPFAELSIANPGIADISTLSETTIYVLGKAPGRTTLTLLAPDGTLITNVEVQVTADVSELKERLREVLPRESIEVRPANDGLVMSGIVSSSQALDRALDLAQRYAPGRVSNLMHVGGTQQVMLKVRFAEMSRSISKSLSASLGIGDSGAVAAGSGAINNADSLNNLFANGQILNAPVQGNGGGTTLISFGGSDIRLNLLLEALETQGFVRTLAEPNLSALSGQNAEFLAGGEFPVPVSDGDGNVSVDFRPFGILMNFTPRVIGQNINLRMTAEVSNIDTTSSVTANQITIPAFSVRRTQTTVELQDGESFAIAGLIEDNFRDDSSQVPWLGDVPILGALFRSTSYQRDQSELVVIVSAHLVSPTRGEALALPTDRVRPPTERELFLGGKTAASNLPRRGAAGEVARQDFSGSYGYVME